MILFRCANEIPLLSAAFPSLQKKRALRAVPEGNSAKGSYFASHLLSHLPRGRKAGVFLVFVFDIAVSRGNTVCHNDDLFRAHAAKHAGTFRHGGTGRDDIVKKQDAFTA